MIINPALYIAVFLPLLVILIQQRNNRAVLAKKLIEKKYRKDDPKMLESVKQFIGKECLLYTFSNAQISGTVKEISGNAVLIENKNTIEAVNLDYIVRIREYPKGKNGKKKSIVID